MRASAWHGACNTTARRCRNCRCRTCACWATATATAATALVRLRQGPPMLAQQAALPGTDWQLTLLSNTSQARVVALNSAALAGVLTAFVLLLGAAWNVRRRVIGERLAARAALEAANSELERKVAERTADLSTTNQRLQGEVAERIRTEAVLRQAQDGLLQAGKLAAVGQMSTGIAHELNQPLAALRTISGNTSKFLDRGDYDTVRSNLGTIISLVERMGRITGALKSFARKSATACARRSSRRPWITRCSCLTPVSRPCNPACNARSSPACWWRATRTGWNRCWSTCSAMRWTP
ncbi:sensor histidine kinase [Cupriavidus basilensis]